jgi:ketosteroid isomerase-like protein
VSQENVEVVQRAIEAATRRPPDWATVNALFAPDHEYVSLTNWVARENQHTGVEGWRKWVARIEEIGTWSAEFYDYRVGSDGRVVVLGLFWLTGEQSGAQAEQRIGLVVNVSNGMVTRTEAFPEWETALKVVGLEE